MSTRARKRLAVIGGVAAGLSAAARARRMDPELEISVFERTGYCSYTACGLPYFVGGTIDDASSLVVRDAPAFLKQDIKVYLSHEVTEIDLDTRSIRVRDLEEQRERSEPFDQLLISAGAAPAGGTLCGDLEGVFTLRTVEDALAIKAWIETRNPTRALIVGGGYIGLEMAEALLDKRLEVTLIERAKELLPFVDPDMGRLVEQELTRNGVEVLVETEIESVNGSGEIRSVTVGGEEHPCDLAVIAVGVKPDAGVAQAAGLPVGERGALVVDQRMETPIEGVWAAGDCCETRHLLHDRPAYVPLGTTANKQGRVAGANIAGADERFGGVVGTAALKVCDLQVARTGLSSAEAREAGFEAVSATIEHISRARYYPGGAPMTVSMIAERGSGRLLGAQLAGREGVAKRVDVVAAALHSRVTARDLSEFDLSYAPPFAPVWDPLLLAARKVASEAERSAG